ncbi:MAG: aldehyde ferredoxin oxidoreductase [Deltaproteobacteria bacterium]|jgi:aldehyde:ferredoxin oxidoreductase|nr:aldehyde ferredoxin oxidoreductase [Deltaproteobacteria bacterium]
MKFIRVDMGAKTVSIEDKPREYERLGGRRLTSTFVNAEVPPTCDPLGPENKLIFAPGLLSGTPLVNTSRLSVGSKSPLTGGIKESNAGGTIGMTMGRREIAGLIVEGKPEAGELFILRVESYDKVSLVPADEYKGMRTYALAEKLFETYGEDNSIMCIGPAGENLYKSASIQSTDVDNRPCRCSGRGGLGAVMGSKGLKAVVVQRSRKPLAGIHNPAAFKDGVKVFTKAILQNPTAQLLKAQGTPALLAMINSLGAFPCFNATKGVMENWEKISGEKLAEIMKERGGQPVHRGCSGCVIHCSNVYVDKSGQYVTSSLEYETVWSMGGMTGLLDPDIIAQLDRLCDDIGVDTMNTGVAMSVAMDAGHKKFGDGQALLDMMEEIGNDTEFGRILGNGPAEVGKHFSHHRVPVVKNQSIAGYDPRGMQGTGVTYSTSPMGADHTSGNTTGKYLDGTLVSHETKGQMEASRAAQVMMAFLDSMGLCIMAGVGLMVPDSMMALFAMINARLGTNLGMETISLTGVNTILVEKEFNRRAGFTVEDDRLPKFFYEEPLAPHNKVFGITDEQLDQTHNF